MNGLVQVGWAWHPSVLTGFSLWTVAYWLTVGPLRHRHSWGAPPAPFRQVAFHFGTLVGLLALVSPLDELGDEFLFSAHMVQHLLLMFVTAPCWLIGTPAFLIDRALPESLVRLGKRITQPMPAFAIFVGTMWLWHFPRLYAAAQGNEGLHIIQHLTYIGAALIGWWPIAGPSAPAIPQPPPPLRLLYVFLLGIPCTVLGAIFTFAPAPIYSYYILVPHPFGMDALDDQRLAGLLMWVPTHMILVLSLGIIFSNWIRDADRPPDAIQLNSLSRS